jgi:hypothetical protein
VSFWPQASKARAAGSMRPNAAWGVFLVLGSFCGLFRRPIIRPQPFLCHPRHSLNIEHPLGRGALPLHDSLPADSEHTAKARKAASRSNRNIKGLFRGFRHTDRLRLN